jgi:hypothetical protein
MVPNLNGRSPRRFHVPGEPGGGVRHWAPNDRAMAEFSIKPPLPIRDRPGLVLTSTDQATEFAREMAKARNSPRWDGVLFRLEAARTEEEARDAVNALRAMLEQEHLVELGSARD